MTICWPISGAVNHRHRLHIVYYSAHSDEVTERIIRPYLLLNWNGELYMIGYCEMRQGMRDFALHRIRERTVLEPERAFTVPDSFDAVAYLESAMAMRRGEPVVTVRVKFSPLQSRWIKERTIIRPKRPRNWTMEA